MLEFDLYKQSSSQRASDKQIGSYIKQTFQSHFTWYIECLLTSYQDILFNILDLFTILLASSIESWKTSSFYITFFSIALKVFQSGFLDSIFFHLASIRQSLLNSEDMVCIECLVVHFFYRYDNYQRPSYLLGYIQYPILNCILWEGKLSPWNEGGKVIEGFKDYDDGVQDSRV